MTRYPLAPLLSEEDLDTSQESPLDPLGLYPIADALAVKLVPGVRERQSRIRFLTVIAVGAAVCSHREPDELAADGRSEPWQVFEWYVVEGLVRASPKDADLRGLPGIDKARRAIRDGVPLCAARYLKTPTVFGFHGVYRVLARSLDVEQDGRLGETGFELLETWENEQKLGGFSGSEDGPGVEWRRRLAQAVDDGMDAGAVARKAGWSGWSFFAKHLAPDQTGRREAEVIRRALLDEREPFRRQVLSSLISEEGRRVWDATGSERAFHQFLLRRADRPLRDLLETVSLYEHWARLLQDAFDDCLHRMTRRGGKTPVRSLSETPLVQRAAKEIPELYCQLLERLAPYGESRRFQETFQLLGDRLPVPDWTQRLLEHHRRVERQKPPHGKNPWFERFDNGSVAVRPGYRRDQGGRGGDEYVHGYRTAPLSSFVADLEAAGQ